jgi:hypothetical protein
VLVMRTTEPVVTETVPLSPASMTPRRLCETVTQPRTDGVGASAASRGSRRARCRCPVGHLLQDAHQYSRRR